MPAVFPDDILARLRAIEVAVGIGPTVTDFTTSSSTVGPSIGGTDLAQVIAYYEAAVTTPDINIAHLPTGTTNTTVALGDEAANLISAMPTVDTTDHAKAVFFTSANVTYLDVSNLLADASFDPTIGIFADRPADLRASKRSGFAVVYAATAGSADVTAGADTFLSTDAGMTLTELANAAFPVGTTVVSVLGSGAGATMSQKAIADQAFVVAQVGRFTMVAPDYRLRADGLYVGHASHVAARVATTDLDSAQAGSVTQITIPWSDDTTLSFPAAGTGSCAIIDESVAPKDKIWVYDYTVAVNDRVAGDIVLTVTFRGGGNAFQYALGAPGDTVTVGLHLFRYDPKDQQFVRLVSANTWNDTTTWFMDSYVPGPAGAIQIDGFNQFGPRWGTDNNSTGVGLNFSRTFQNQDGSDANANYLAQSFSDAFNSSNASFNPRNVFDIVSNHVWASFTNGRMVTGIYSGLSFENFLSTHYGGGAFGTGYQTQVSIHNNVWASPPSLGGRAVTVTLVQGSATVTATSGTFALTDEGAGIQGVGIPPGAKVATFHGTTSVDLNVTAPINGSVAAQVGSYVDVSLGYDYGDGGAIGLGANDDNSRDIPFCKATASNQITAYINGGYGTKNFNAFQQDDIGQGPGFNNFGGTWGYTVVDVSTDGATVTIDTDLPGGVGATGTLTLFNYWRRPATGARRNVAARFAGGIELYPTGKSTLTQPGAIAFYARPEDYINAPGLLIHSYPNNSYVPLISSRGTQTFAQDGLPYIANQQGIFNSATTFSNFLVAVDLPTAITFYAHNTYESTVGSTAIIPDIRDFYSWPSVLVGSGGTGFSVGTGGLSGTGDVTGFESNLTVGTSATVYRRKGYEVVNATVNGTLAGQYGVFINELTTGTINVGLFNRSTTQFQSGTQLVVASSTLTPTGTTWNIASAADITLTAGPTIQGGVDGQLLYLRNTGSFNITLRDSNFLTGSFLNLGANITLAPGKGIELLYNGSTAVWDRYSEPMTLTDTTFTVTRNAVDEILTTLSSVSTGDNPTENTVQGRQTTTSSTTPTLNTITIPANTMLVVDSWIYARRTGGSAAGLVGDSAAQRIVSAFKNGASSGNNYSTVGVQTTLAYMKDTSTAWPTNLGSHVMAGGGSTGPVAIRAVGINNVNLTFHSIVRYYLLGT